MSSNEYNYDADAQFFPFFVLTIGSIITLPLTYTLLQKPSDTSIGKISKIDTTFQPDNADIIDTQRAKQKRRELRLKRMIAAAIGWAVLAYMLYLIIVTARHVPKIWNPYDILDISMSATEKQINSKYRRLSITMHPDKRQPDPVKNLTVENINDEWVEIVKAYKALTDEDVRNNFIQYGHPDGKQSTSFGIALPKFLIADGNGKYVLLFYGALLAIGLPWLVGRWWYGMQKLTKEKVLVTSAGNMFKEYSERMESSDVVAAISTAGEVKEMLGSRADAGLSTLEKEILIEDAARSLSAKDRKNLLQLDDASRRKALALLWAYLHRVKLEDRSLEAEKYELAPVALHLTEAFTATCLAYASVAPALASYHLTQGLTQAIAPGKSRYPLLQLPHFTPEIIQYIESKYTTKSKDHLSVQAFMDIPAAQRTALAKSAGLDQSKLKEAEHVARQLPYLRIEKTFFKVHGEKYVLPNSLVSFVVKARFIPPGTTNIPPVKEADLEDPDFADGDLEAMKRETPQHRIPLAHAPYLPRDRTPKWHMFLSDNRTSKIAVPPFTFQSFDKKAFTDDGKPTFEVVTLKMQFAAPPQAGEYEFYLNMICDSYLGFDDRRKATMNVEDASKATTVEDEDDISEPEEGELMPYPIYTQANQTTDSIAGQMAALKGQTPSDKPKRVRQPKKDEESDYESGTDEDEDDSETDTDTDTDEE